MIYGLQIFNGLYIELLCMCVLVRSRPQYDFNTLPQYREQYAMEPNTATGELVNQWNESWYVNPEELGDYYEGDIIKQSVELRSITNNLTSRWVGGIVPYELVGPYSEKAIGVFNWAFNEYHTKTCIKFTEKTSKDIDYLVISNNNTGCWSNLGRQGGRQEVNLQFPSCLSEKRKGTALHELMHALGIKHEHTRTDRDDYITVLMDNIMPNKSINFEKSLESEVIHSGIPYDFGSVMHYSMYAFSVDSFKRPTLRPKISQKLLEMNPDSFRLGQRNQFSEIDIKKINIMYCQGREFSRKNNSSETLKNVTNIPLSKGTSWPTNFVEAVKNFWSNLFVK